MTMILVFIVINTTFVCKYEIDELIGTKASGRSGQIGSQTHQLQEIFTIFIMIIIGSVIISKYLLMEGEFLSQSHN
ncbi:hypothetical protein D5E84_23805 [Vibrio parahaemolyticus]|nr:hypothetical protein D5E84_23805 [Vibrio parahaemolyticus]